METQGQREFLTFCEPVIFVIATNQISLTSQSKLSGLTFSCQV